MMLTPAKNAIRRVDIKYMLEARRMIRAGTKTATIEIAAHVGPLPRFLPCTWWRARGRVQIRCEMGRSTVWCVDV